MASNSASRRCLPFRFTDLPLELREGIYKSAAWSCRNVAVRPRYPLPFWPDMPAGRPTPTTWRRKYHRVSAPGAPHLHTLHNLRRASKFFHLEVGEAIYCYAPAVALLGSPNMRQALLDINSSPSHLLIETNMLTELNKYHFVDLEHGFQSSSPDFWTIARNVDNDIELRGFLDNWEATSQDRPLNAQLRVSMYRIWYKYDFFTFQILDNWINGHPAPELLRKSIRFTFDELENYSGSFQFCTLWGTRAPHLRRDEQILACIRKFCCKHHALVESSIDWAGLTIGDLDDHGIEVVQWQQRFSSGKRSRRINMDCW